MRVTQVEVEGLFGYVHHLVQLQRSSPTIITAPNGAGKTHILNLLAATLSLDIKVLFLTNFRTFRATFTDAHSLVVTRTADFEGNVSVTIHVERAGSAIGSVMELSSDDLEASDSELPSFIRKVGANRWLDVRSGRIVTRSLLERRYRRSLNGFLEILRSRSPEVVARCSGPEPVLIDTKRLDVAGIGYPESEFSTVPPQESSGAATRIHEYMAQLRAEVTEARRSSIQATQSTDLSFATRALAAANLRVKEAELHRRYDKTVERYENLARNALAVGEAPIEFPAETSPTVRRILSVFLDDWDKRLEPLVPLNEKIQTLREILDAKLATTGKRTAMSSRGGLEFRSFGDRKIRVADLSSGEQHMVALFTLLLFSAKSGSLVLIDEPEISFHAAWKHDFLSDISRVAEISDLQVVMATHSSAIINGRWDLTEELVIGLPSYDDVRQDDADIFDDGDDFEE